jgi:hypothetical protein
MTTVAATRSAAAAPRSRLDAYRDDGPLARVLGRALGDVVPLPAVVLTLVSALPLVAVLVLDGAGVDEVALGVAVAWCVLAGGIASGRPDSGRFAWTVPPLLRLLEYGGLLALATLTAPRALPWCFALVGVLAFHHYDTVYRLRHQGVAPPQWLSLAGGGWDGRLLLAYVLLLAGALPTGLLVAAVVLAVTYLVESVASWLRFTHAQRPALYDDDEDEDE